MSGFEAFILGLVQGLTEFLPVSSSGHLTIGKYLFGIDAGAIGLGFDVTVHAATVLATIVVFRKDILRLLKGFFKFQYNEESEYLYMIAVSMIPVFIVGMFFKDFVEDIFGSGLVIVGVCLLVTATLLWLSEHLKRSQKSGEGSPMTFKTAIWMGLAQALAVLPGLSRSGSTISAGLLCGTKKEEVAEFSFLMVLIPILGEAFLDLVKSYGAYDGGASVSIGATTLAIGFLAAFASGMFACKVMISIVKKARLKWFALYCVAASALCFVLNSIA